MNPTLGTLIRATEGGAQRAVATIGLVDRDKPTVRRHVDQIIVQEVEVGLGHGLAGIGGEQHGTGTGHKLFSLVFAKFIRIIYTGRVGDPIEGADNAFGRQREVDLNAELLTVTRRPPYCRRKVARPHAVRQ